MIWTILIGVVLVIFVMRLVRAMATVLVTVAVIGAVVVYGGGLDLRQLPDTLQGALQGTGLSLPDPLVVATTAGAWTLCALETVARVAPSADERARTPDGRPADPAASERSACDGL